MRKNKAKHWDVICILPNETASLMAHDEKLGPTKALFDLARLRPVPLGATLALVRTAKDESVQVVEALVMGPKGWTTVIEGDRLAAEPLFPSAGGCA